MKNHEHLIHENIIRDMSEGVMTIGFDGVITHINPAAEAILGIPAAELVGRRFALCFFEFPENDAFNQAILDAVYHPESTHKNVVSYFTGSEKRQLQITASCLKENNRTAGIIVVLNDISELSELRDAVVAMKRIQKLNDQLQLRNQLLSETFGRFLSDEIVRQLLDTPDGLALGGKKRELTIMMSDLRGFTAMSERMEPDSLLSMLNHYLGEMTQIIQKHNGTIIEFIGDGIMAIFGAPAFDPDHASNAAAAAIEMQACMHEINAWNADRSYPRLEMGISLNTGEVIVGNIGSEKRTKYGVVGNQVNLCGRIESYTVGGQVLISPKTRSQISTDLEIAQEMEVFPKGVQEALKLSQLTGIGAPYNLSCAEEFAQPIPLRRGIPVRFAPLVSKHGSVPDQEGVITALSDTGAILESRLPLKIFDNLKIEAGGELFAKIIRQENTGWLLRFTALPEGFNAWREKFDQQA